MFVTDAKIYIKLETGVFPAEVGDIQTVIEQNLLRCSK